MSPERLERHYRLNGEARLRMQQRAQAIDYFTAHPDKTTHHDIEKLFHEQRVDMMRLSTGAN